MKDSGARANEKKFPFFKLELKGLGHENAGEEEKETERQKYQRKTKIYNTDFGERLEVSVGAMKSMAKVLQTPSERKQWGQLTFEKNFDWR